jgi:hypothetical protein
MSTNDEHINKENPNLVDNVLVQLADKLSPLFKKMNYTPNGIITLSLILNSVSLYYLGVRDFVKFSIYHFLGYFFDVLAEHYGRKYELHTDQSDRYNNIKNLGIGLLFATILYDRYNILNYPILLIVLLCLLVLMMINIGCEKQIKKTNRTKVLESINCNKYIKMIRNAGNVTMHVIIVIIVWYLYREYESSIINLDKI